MVLSSSDASSVAIVADKLLSEQEADLNLFVITKHHLVNMSHPRRGVRMDLKFRRKIMSELMTTYFPSLLLMMITYATTFFKPFFFEAALSVNLTTMLVMTTIFISKMESLPPTSDIKMIDIWLIFCQIYPFVEVVLLTAMEYRREEKKEKRKGRKRKSDVQIVSSISMMEGNETRKTRCEELAGFVSEWKAPSLKTIGRLLTSSQPGLNPHVIQLDVIKTKTG